jgi:N-acetylneuraminic acid mutarotase
MVVWGGWDSNGPYYNTGGRYNPNTDSWTSTSLTNAPSARNQHTALWTGNEMIVWGGFFYDGRNHYLNTGGRYNPGTDSWTGTTTTNAPEGRTVPTAVWTGSEMIVGGGRTYPEGNLNSGGRYNPSTDSWTPTLSTPTQRWFHTALWTGSEMIVWGGQDQFQDIKKSGGKYNPDTDSWDITNAIDAPRERELHTAVWTGTEMIIWGGLDESLNLLNTGGRYNPAANSWTNTTTTKAPEGRYGHTAIWTGSEMIVWGGYADTAGDPLNTGGRYNPGTNSWTATSTINAPDARAGHRSVWTGNEMILWGGCFLQGSYQCFNTGGRYDPNTDSWTATSATNAPSARAQHTTVWTGNEIIVWGGVDYGSNTYFNSGGKYDPNTDTWTATSITNAPVARYRQAGVWTGNEIVVWGGSFSDDSGYHYLDSGGRYNPTTNSWMATITINAPSPRELHTAVWTGSEMIVWGGADDTEFFNTGGSYCAQSGPTPSPSPTPSSTPRLTPTPRSRPSPHPRP